MLEYSLINNFCRVGAVVQVLSAPLRVSGAVPARLKYFFVAVPCLATCLCEFEVCKRTQDTGIIIIRRGG